MIPFQLNLTSLGQRIRLARKRKHMTQVVLCNALSICVSYLSKIENAKTTPSLELVAHIAHVLETSMDYLLHDTLYDNSTSFLKNHSLESYAEQLKIVFTDCTDEERDFYFNLMLEEKKLRAKLSKKQVH